MLCVGTKELRRMMAIASITTVVAGSIDYTLYRSCNGPPLYFITDISLSYSHLMPIILISCVDTFSKLC